VPAALDLTGLTMGRLVVLDRSHRDNTGAWVWRCRCECDREVYVRGATLKAGRTSACASCATSAANITHGHTGTPLYARWRAMLGRTGNPNYRHWANYGGRGITVCDEWLDFTAFARDMGESFRPDLELDRIDTNGNYEPTNCRWITHRAQQRNKRTNHVVEWAGRSLTVQDWSEVLGVKANTIVTRLRRGWSTERALTKDVPADVLLEFANTPQETR